MVFFSEWLRMESASLLSRKVARRTLRRSSVRPTATAMGIIRHSSTVTGTLTQLNGTGAVNAMQTCHTMIAMKLVADRVRNAQHADDGEACCLRFFRRNLSRVGLGILVKAKRRAE